MRIHRSQLCRPAYLLLGLWLCLATPISAQEDKLNASLMVINANITTQDDAQPEASALAVYGQRLLAVGTVEDVKQHQTASTQVIDAGGRRLIPGLNDVHAHFVRGGRFYNTELRWDGIPSLRIALDRVRRQAKRTPKGQWVRVIGGWSPFQFEEKRMLTPEELTEAAPNTPVFVLYLYSRGFLNQAGLEMLGITPDNAAKKAPKGTRYELKDGKLTGRLLADPNPTILYQTIGALPGLSEADQVNSTRHFYRELNRFGLTSAIDAGGGGHTFPEHYVGSERLAESGNMPIRISYYLFPQRPGNELTDFRRWFFNHHVNHNEADLYHGYELKGGGEFLVWSAGDFENFTAPMPDISQAPNWRQELKATTQFLVRQRWPLRIHATYDASIGHILGVFEEVDQEERAAGRPGFRDFRWSIEHAETLKSGNLSRIKQLGGGIAVQSRMPFAGEYFVERYGKDVAASAPPLRAILEAGIPLGAGTDATRVSTYNPWVALEWLVTGKSVGGMPLLDDANQLSRTEALYVYTVGSAWFSQEEHVKGRLAPGQYADFAILSHDYFTVSEDEIDSIESVLTVTGGKVVYGAGEYAKLAPPLPPVSPDWSPVATFGGYYKATATR